jgi:hypothetical protein
MIDTVVDINDQERWRIEDGRERRKGLLVKSKIAYRKGM